MTVFLLAPACGGLSHIPLFFKVQQDLLGRLVGGQLRGVDGDIRVAGLDIYGLGVKSALDSTGCAYSMIHDSGFRMPPLAELQDA